MRCLTLLLLIAFQISALPGLYAAPLKAGIAVVDITPPVGWRMSGYFYERVSTGTHDPLQAKAIVLEQGGARAALVFCDLIGISRDVSTRTRVRASRKTGIPVANILIAGTHTHTGPLYSGGLREHFHQAAIAKDGKDPYEAVDYPSILVDRLADTIARAARAVQPVSLHAGKARQPGLSFNRRYLMKDGSVVTNPGKLNTNVVRAAGPIDPELLVLLVQETERSRLVASLTSFPLHADTVGGTQYGADYPPYLERVLQMAFGTDFVSLFGNGTCGDINHVNVADARPQKGHAEAGRIGAALGETVINSVSTLDPIRKPALAVRSATLAVPLQRFDVGQVAQARERMSKVGGKELPFLAQVEAAKIMDLQLRGVTSLPLEVQVFRLGPNTAIVGLPGEIFVELGLAIKKASPFRNTFIIELCNESIGYVPTKKAFAEGSYEVTNSRVQPGGGEMLADAAIRLLKELKY